jgi:hypothetical protein
LEVGFGVVGAPSSAVVVGFVVCVIWWKPHAEAVPAAANNPIATRARNFFIDTPFESVEADKG